MKTEDRKAFKASFWFAICNIVQKSAMLISVPIFTRMMTSDEYGLTTVFQSWNNVLVIVVTLSLYMGVFNNGMLRYRDDRDGYIAAMQGLSSISALLFLLLFIFFYKSTSHIIGLSPRICLLMFFYYIFYPSFEYWSARNRYEYKYRGLLFVTIIYTILNILIPYISVKVGKGNLGEVKIESTLIVLTIFSIIFYIINLCKGKSLFNREYWKYAFWFNLPLIPNYLSTILLNQSDRIMINHFCGPTPAGIYSIACYLQTGVTVIISALNSAFVPWLYEKLESETFGEIQKRAETILILLGTMTFGIVSCAPEIIRIMAPPNYYSAIWSVAPVVYGSYITALYMLFANVEIYYEKRVFMTIATSLAAVLNIALNYIMIPYWGYIACAYTTVFSYIVYVIAHYIFMQRIVINDKKLCTYRIYNLRKDIVLYSIVAFGCAVQLFLFNVFLLRYFLLLVVLLAIFVIERRSINAIR